MAHADIERLQSIKTFPSLVKYLRDDLEWPIDSDDVEELTFDYEPEELGIDPKTAAKIQEIKQLRPLDGKQPWGIFFVKFEPKRLPVVVLRKILNQLVIKKRAAAGKAMQAAWHQQDLLFISSYGEKDQRHITFAHFTQDPAGKDLPTLKVLGWDAQDTVLHVDAVVQKLKTSFRWPRGTFNPDQVREQWSAAFTYRHREVITTSKELAQRLAELARNIRQQVLEVMRYETDKGPIRQLFNAFRTALIHDLEPEGFADTYAQTIAYGLLSSRIADPTKTTLDDFAAHMRTNPFLRELMETFLRIGGRKGKAGGPGIDFDELGVSEVVALLDEADMEAVVQDFGDRNPTEDPVIHFYEHFLAAYDKKLKVSRGVFYTPQPVVSYIVRSVHELLQTEFGLEDGLADTTTWGEMLKKHPGLKLPPLTDEPREKRTISPDEPFVQILDPATGTATFLVEVIEVIHQTLQAKWKKQRLTEAQQLTAWNDYVPKHLLPRLHGYELMMAPYAIAHMKIGLKLAETGYTFDAEERARIFLTNALEPWVHQPPLLGLDALAHEATAVNEIKRHKRFTVVIGNPPYSNFGMLNKSPFILGLLEDYKRGLDEKKLNLDDDFIKFVRFAHHLLHGCGIGLFGMITSSTYLDGLTHRQMRASLCECFPGVFVIDLHGSSKRQEKNPSGGSDENVFDIQTGVAVTILVKKTAAFEARYAELWGEREEKYNNLDSSSHRQTVWANLSPEAPYHFLRPKEMGSAAEYQRWQPLKECFLVGGCGIKTERDRVSIHSTEQECRQAVEDFRDLTESELREKYCLESDSRDWKVANAKADVRTNRDESLFRRVLYRPFDTRHIWYSGQTRGFVGTPGYPTMRHMLDGQNLALLACRQQAELGFHHVFCTTLLAECCAVSLKTREITSIFPLYLLHGDRSQGSLALNPEREPNFSPAFKRLLSSRFSKPQKDSNGLPAGITPENIFHYIYAVFHSPVYRSRYAEFLKIDFPRIPLTGSEELFRLLAHIGFELTKLHLLESSRLDQPITKLIGNRSPSIEKVSWSDDTVWVDKAKTNGFRSVPESVWGFRVGGYRVCEKWLKDRKGNTLSNEDILHYKKIVIALSETIHLMAEIDEVIEANGGWPGAFVTRD